MTGDGCVCVCVCVYAHSNATIGFTFTGGTRGWYQALKPRGLGKVEVALAGCTLGGCVFCMGVSHENGVRGLRANQERGV